MLIKSQINWVRIDRNDKDFEVFRANGTHERNHSNKCEIVIDFTLFDNHPDGKDAGKQLPRRTINQLMALIKKPVMASDRKPVVEEYGLHAHRGMGLEPTANSGVIISLDNRDPVRSKHARVSVDDVIDAGVYRFSGVYRLVYDENSADYERLFKPNADGEFGFTIAPGGTVAPTGFVTITHFGILPL